MEIRLNETPAAVTRAQQSLGIIGHAPSLLEAIGRALKVAPVDLSVLVRGETGTGKEYFPRIIHNNSLRKHGPYIAVNCGAIPEGTIDSELFGHEKGAFTSAVSMRRGYFEEASGGTIFLDEVGELPLTTQARLLRVLETGEFMRVGSSQVLKTDVRIVAATNVDMPQAVAAGKFREDLYYRLATVEINVPPLRERGDDISLLTRSMARDFAERYHMPEVRFSDGAFMALKRYRWPGNVRQLKNVVEQLVLFASGSEITAEDVAAALPHMDYQMAPSGGGASSTCASGLNATEREILVNMVISLQREVQSLKTRLDEMTPTEVATIVEPVHDTAIVPYVAPETASEATLEDAERETIRRALERHAGRRKAVAAELNISERTLYRKIKEYGLE